MSDQLHRMEAMALAVLKGDMAAARALADQLAEHWAMGETEILPSVRTINVPVDRLRAVFFSKNPLTEAALRNVEDLFSRWVYGEIAFMVLSNGMRMELYELPAQTPKEKS